MRLVIRWEEEGETADGRSWSLISGADEKHKRSYLELLLLILILILLCTVTEEWLKIGKALRA